MRLGAPIPCALPAPAALHTRPWPPCRISPCSLGWPRAWASASWATTWAASSTCTAAGVTGGRAPGRRCQARSQQAAQVGAAAGRIIPAVASERSAHAVASAQTCPVLCSSSSPVCRCRIKCWECGVKKKAPCGMIEREDLPWCCHRRLGEWMPLMTIDHDQTTGQIMFRREHALAGALGTLPLLVTSAHCSWQGTAHLIFAAGPCHLLRCWSPVQTMR